MTIIIFKCKMCGGDLEIGEQMAVGTCRHCGSTMTLPKAADERIANLFNRANFYRRSSEFDKAIKVYENILNEDNTNAEAHWSLVISKYGIEYVEDPATAQRIPTCHRTQKTSIFLDADYQQALEYADSDARQVYEAEAAAIDAIQKLLLAISEQEEPYEFFICYKETSETGSRTKDSLLAQDIYHHLAEEGYKVFFSRISLEDKLGIAYEPYIFAALNSSTVMIVVATSAENVNAVWTKNEWSRYLALINKGDKKALIPVYRDMDPYELPEEFSHLQAQDMGRLGFMQDLVRGVKKILESGNKPEQKSIVASVGETGATTQSLLDRAFISLEDGEWSKADELLERALDIEPRNAKAYIGKLMIELQVMEEEALALQTKPLNQSKYYDKALKFADDKYKSILLGYNELTLKQSERLEQIGKNLGGRLLYISYSDGAITLTDLPIGARVVDTSWEWEYQSANLFMKRIVKPVNWIVVAKDHYTSIAPHVTLLSEELIGKICFDNSSNRGSFFGSNHWGDSGTSNATLGHRTWLNATNYYYSGGFYKAFSASFKAAVIETDLPNKEWENGTPYSTKDYVFDPSTTELGDKTHKDTYQIGTTYPYFAEGAAAKRVSLLGGKHLTYVTRSPGSSSSSVSCDVAYAGKFERCEAYSSNVGIRPALNLKSETVVSEI